MSTTLQTIFNARAIAVIGASNDPAKRGNQAIRKLHADGYSGAIYPVNPKQTDILGFPAYRSVLDIDAAIDLVLVCTPANTLPGILKQCGEKNIPGAVVLAAGFAESGQEGVAIAKASLEAAVKHKVRVLGPNTNGIINLHNTMNLVGVQDVEPGGIGICSQSGNMMLAFITEAKRRGGIGFSSYVGVGNQLDVDLAEYLTYFANDENTKVPVFYVEGFKDGRAFLDACRKAIVKKPVVVYKSGRTEAGQIAAASHTGSLASGFALSKGLLRQAGVTVVEESDKILSIAEGLSKLPVPAGGRVAILADGGGHATVTVDALSDAGIDLAVLCANTQAVLKAALPASASLVNPVDVAGGTDDNPENFAVCAEAILQDPNVDILLIVGMYGGYAARFNPLLLDSEIITSNRLSALATQYGKPLIVQSVYTTLRTQPIEVLKTAGVPVFIWAENAVRCIAELIAYAQARQRISQSALPEPEGPLPAGLAIVDSIRSARREAFYEYEARELLAAYGVTMPAHFIARSEDDLTKAAQQFTDVPVAMKIISQDILHKSEAGGVRLQLKGEVAMRQAYQDIMHNAQAYQCDADIQGVLVTPMATAGVEIIIGVVHDPMFGPVMMFGLGGIFVEVLRDVAFRALPMSTADAFEMIAEIQSAAILDGVRGGLPVDKKALVDLIMRASQLSLAHPEISEIDLNPVILRNDGYDVVDVRMLLKSQA